MVVRFFFSSRRRHTRCGRDWSSDVCSSDLGRRRQWQETIDALRGMRDWVLTTEHILSGAWATSQEPRSEEHTSELQSRPHLVCRLLLEKKNKSQLLRIATK